jgi:hypothetical protein
LTDSKVLYMVAKAKHFHKWSPHHNVAFKANYIKGFRGLKDECVRSKVTKLAIPAMGTGLDRLKWPWVREKIERVFHDVDIHIRVYHRPPRERTGRSQQPATSADVNNGAPEQPVSAPGSSRAASTADQVPPLLTTPFLPRAPVLIPQQGPVVPPLLTTPVLPGVPVLLPQQGPVVPPLLTTPVFPRAPVLIPQQAPVLPHSPRSTLPPSQQLLQTDPVLLDAASVLVGMSLGDHQSVTAITEQPTVLNPAATSFSTSTPTVPLGGILATQAGAPSVSSLLSALGSSVAHTLSELSGLGLSFGQDKDATVRQCVNDSTDDELYSDNGSGTGLFD